MRCSVPVNTFLSVSDKEEKFITFKDDMKLDKMAELVSEMISA